jgi:hypothetical protein
MGYFRNKPTIVGFTFDILETLTVMQRALFVAFADLPPSGQIHDRSDNKPARCVFCSRAAKVASCYARSLRRLERIALRSTYILRGDLSIPLELGHDTAVASLSRGGRDHNLVACTSWDGEKITTSSR